MKKDRTNEMCGPSNAVKVVLLWIVRWLYAKVVAVVCRGASKTTPTLKNSILMESASSLGARIRSGKVTSLEVVQSFINRIQEVNEVLNCVVDERFEAALSEAEKADEAIRSGRKSEEELKRERPLLGVPFTSPDALAVEGLSNTMGMPNRQNVKANADTKAIALMRAAGAIPIACTNVSESCFLWETNNPVFGRTSNPYDTNRTVGGPFGAEACLNAVCGSPVGIARFPTVPSAFNGVFGHKPSENVSCDAAGPISRSSADLLPVLRILAQNSTTDLRLDDPVDLTKLRYYFMDGDGGSFFTSPVSEDIKGAIQKAVHHFESTLNASVERLHVRQMEKAYFIWQFKAPRGKASQVNFFNELLKASFGKTQHTLLFLLASLTDRTVRHSDFDQLTRDYNLLLKTFQDLLGSDGVFIYPTHPTAAFRHNDSFAKEFDFGYSAIFDALGLPATHCPAGLDSDGLPIGFQVVAGLHQDRLTLAVAREIDKALGGWTPPPTHGTFTLKSTLFHTSSNQKVKVL